VVEKVGITFYKYLVLSFMFDVKGYENTFALSLVFIVSRLH